MNAEWRINAATCMCTTSAVVVCTNMMTTTTVGGTFSLRLVSLPSLLRAMEAFASRTGRQQQQYVPVRTGTNRGGEEHQTRESVSQSANTTIRSNAIEAAALSSSKSVGQSVSHPPS
eukprot:GHVU01099389.1.p1 GENE.GHVU01099389.1~~GHVU01099389.1.p1  ORF type:complete len:117 (+),score=14.47 GHVU01099389.1:252-602(+)